MPTYREDLHLGHKVPLIETDDIMDRAITSIKIALEAITTELIADGAVTPEKLSDRVFSEVLKPLLDKLDKLDKEHRDILNDLQNQIDSFNEHGVSVSNRFGDDPHIGISQKTLTEAINRIWDKFDEITGESSQGIELTISPEYFIGEDGCNVHITAAALSTNGIFEHLAFYVNGSLLVEAEDTDYFEYDTTIRETSVIKCTAQILGIEYTKRKAIVHYSSFWLGAGSAYSDIMDVEHVIPITNGMRGAYDITASEGDHIFIVVGDSLREGFIRADMNGIEIPMTASQVTVEGSRYTVYRSDNPVKAGTYNIDING